MNPTISRRSGAFLAFWILGVGILVWYGTQMDYYKLSVMHIPPPHPYPWKGVLAMIAVQSVEALFFYAVIRPESYRQSWERAVSALGFSVVLLIFFTTMLQHAPAYMVWHWFWQACVSVTFLFLLCVSIFCVVRARLAKV